MVKNFLFPQQNGSTIASLQLLAARIILGMLFLNHGVDKWASYDVLVTTFPDPIYIGAALSLQLVIFAELICSVAFIFGFLYRLAMIPMIINMGVAFFVVHAFDPMPSKELALVYLVSFILLYISGPGKFSIDALLSRSGVVRTKGKTGTRV